MWLSSSRVARTLALPLVRALVLNVLPVIHPAAPLDHPEVRPAVQQLGGEDLARVLLPFAQHSHLLPKAGAEAILLRLQIMTRLEIQPEPLGGAEVAGES